MEALLLAVAPFVVTWLTQIIKEVQSIKLSAQRVVIIRIIASVLSFLAVILGGWASGETIDPSIVTTFVETTGVLIVSQVVYYFALKK
jgi:hypothetical protein